MVGLIPFDLTVCPQCFGLGGAVIDVESGAGELGRWGPEEFAACDGFSGTAEPPAPGVVRIKGVPAAFDPTSAQHRPETRNPAVRASKGTDEVSLNVTGLLVLTAPRQLLEGLVFRGARHRPSSTPSRPTEASVTGSIKTRARLFYFKAYPALAK